MAVAAVVAARLEVVGPEYLAGSRAVGLVVSNSGVVHWEERSRLKEIEVEIV